MTYESSILIESQIEAGLTYKVAKMSFARRMDLMRRVRELARRAEFLEAGSRPGDKMDAAILQAEIDKLYIIWGLLEVSGLELDGCPATPAALADSGPENVFREALAAVRSETGLNAAERKN